MIISIIVAYAKNRAIGKDNQMIWRLSTDLKRFKRLTSGHHILMGRKTFESLGKPLPNRTNIVITRNPDFEYEGVLVFSDMDEAVKHCQKAGEDELFIIGGGEIYKQMIPEAERMYITKVLATPDADTFFPDFEESEWEVTSEEAHLPDEKNDHAFIFVDLERRESKSVG